MKFILLALCVTAVAAKPHIYRFNGPAVTSASANSEAVYSKSIRYEGPPAPLDVDGRVVDTAEVAQLRSEHLATLNKATAEALAYAVAHPNVETRNPEDASEFQFQDTPRVDFRAEPKRYSGPFASIGHDGRVIDTDEVAKLKVERIVTLEMANAAAAAVAAAEAKRSAFAGGKWSFPALVKRSASFGGYSYEAPVARTQTTPAATSGASSVRGQSQQVYNGSPAPLGKDGRVIDTDEVANLKAEHLAILEKLNAKVAAIEALMASSGYSHEAPSPVAEEATQSSTSSGGNTYKAPAQKAPVPAVTYGAAIEKSQAIPEATNGGTVDSEQPQQVYNGPLAPLGEDGRVIDTDEVAKLKAEHLAILEKANARAAAIEALIASSGYSYEAPSPVAEEATQSSSSSGGYTYKAPAQKAPVPAVTYGAAIEKSQAIPEATNGGTADSEQLQQVYNGPPAPLGQDGRVIDTEEVAKLKAEFLATLAKAHAEAAVISAIEAFMGHSSEAPHPVTESASSSASFGDLANEAPVQETQDITAATYNEPSVPVQPQQVYNGPLATLGQDGNVVDTDEVAKLKAVHLAILAKAYEEAAAVKAMEAALGKSSSEDHSYEAPVQKHVSTPTVIYGSPAATYGASRA